MNSSLRFNYHNLRENIFLSEPKVGPTVTIDKNKESASQQAIGTLEAFPIKLFDNQLFSYKEAARYLRLSEVYLRKLKAKGKIPFVEVGRGIRFRVSSLNAWIAEREIK
ncbi:helix-turn-helix domain-containing protein [Bdellovibrio sp. HCB117]|uniref:helix-turn-helix domain-containing protein n=1 Tax=Bdellovibrio sp. HCB117 TaxID=3394359 RepID=UPI0039B3A08C